MKSFEIMFISIPQDEAFNKLRDFIKDFIEKHKGVIDNIDEWGKRHMQYDIDGYTDGIYALIRFQATDEAVKALNKKLLELSNLSNATLLRFMIIRKGE